MPELLSKAAFQGRVEAEGAIAVGDAITVWLPPQRIYAHA